MNESKRKKGFTLVELLAVIVIMSILMTVAIPSVILISNKMKKNMYCTKVETVEKAAQLYGQDNIDTIQNNRTGDGSCALLKKNASGNWVNDTVSPCDNVTVAILLSKGYLKKEEGSSGAKDDFMDPRTTSGTQSMKSDKLMVYVKNKRVYARFIFRNKEDAELCEGAYYKDGANVKKV